jgi:GTPase
LTLTAVWKHRTSISFNLIIRNKKGVVILVNKWDLVEKDNYTTGKYPEGYHVSGWQPFNDVPIIFHFRTDQTANPQSPGNCDGRFTKTARRKFKTSELNEVMLKAIEKYPPPAWKGKYIKIKYCTQLPTHTPAFAFFANLPQYIKDPYKTLS